MIPGRRWHERAGTSGFTLIETLTAVGVIGLLIAILVPAVQSARETARRCQCANNLKQFGLALHAYHDALSCLPPGRIKMYDPRFAGAIPPCTPTDADKSVEIFILPFMEQSNLFNCVNQSLAIVSAENTTTHSVVVPSFACPSDPLSGFPRDLNPGSLARFGVTQTTQMVFTSYGGSVGSLEVIALPMPANSCSVSPAVIAQSNGVFNDLSPVRLASVSDGLANTVFMTEKATTILQDLTAVNASLFADRGWYVVGNWGDTLTTSLYPVNAWKKVALSATSAWANSASSLHPGGANVLMGDGSVRFVSDSIQCWPSDPISGNPLGSYQSSGGWWVDIPRPGVWQALATRSGGDLIDSGSF